MIRVMLVDDQQMVRAGFRMILDAEPGLTVVGEAADGLEATEMVHRAQPDVILMDVRMARMDGIEACQRICATANNAARIMMLTTFDLHEYVHAALRAGASGFMLKDAPAEQLVEGIKVIANGDALLAPSVTQALIDEIARRPVGQPGKLRQRGRQDQGTQDRCRQRIVGQAEQFGEVVGQASRRGDAR